MTFGEMPHCKIVWANVSWPKNLVKVPFFQLSIVFLLGGVFGRSS